MDQVHLKAQKAQVSIQQHGLIASWKSSALCGLGSWPTILFTSQNKLTTLIFCTSCNGLMPCIISSPHELGPCLILLSKSCDGLPYLSCLAGLAQNPYFLWKLNLRKKLQTPASSGGFRNFFSWYFSTNINYTI